MSRFVDIRRGAYQDSVSLMQVTQEVQRHAGVTTALVAMGTELNLGLLDDLGFDLPAAPSPNDLVVALETTDDHALEAAIAALDEALVRRPPGGGTGAGAVPEPLTVAAAARRTEADLALISTPGRVAVLDAVDALDAGIDVMLFSNNVSTEHEVALKRLAAERGLMVMGPDCGTAVIGGTGLGFANVVRPGPVGIVAASGTGAQHMMTLLDSAGIGVTHCLGVGGRDLTSTVAGLSTLVALERLAGDPLVEMVVVLSKPPAPQVAAAVEKRADEIGKPVVIGVLGPGRPDLTATAEQVAEALAVTWPAPARWGTRAPRPRPGFLRGLFSGGTLCDEAMLVAAEQLGTIASNIPLDGQPALGPDLASTGHTFVDFGDDQLTVGRPHPMIDPTLRLDRLRRELDDPECGVVLLDVVLGHGAHPDPASDLVPVIETAANPVLVSLIGTRDDPQDRDGQARRLAGAGAVVHASNAAATREALSLLEETR